MDSIFTVLDWASGVLCAAAFVMLTFAQKEIRAGHFLIAVAAFMAVMRWILWSFSTDQPWPIRFVVGAIVGGVLLAGFPALLRWSDLRSIANTHQASDELPSVPKPVSTAPASPSEQSANNCIDSPSKINFNGLDVEGAGGAGVVINGPESICMSNAVIKNNAGPNVELNSDDPPGATTNGN